MTTLSQNRWQRNRTGIIGHNPDKAYQGFTMFNAGDTVYLIDMEGNIVHTWTPPYPPKYGRLSEDGTLICGLEVPEESDRFMADKGWKGGGLLEANWDGDILWMVEHPDHHHDAIKLRNGNIMFVCLELLPKEIADRVPGGKPGTEHNGEEMYTDYLVEMTTEGDVVWEWHCADHMQPEDYPITSPNMERQEWTHCNSLEELPDGNLLISYRQTSTVAIVDRESGEIIWEVGMPTVAQQHAPTLLDNGNILIFDNGAERPEAHSAYSRIVEVDQETKEIVWSYQESPPPDFYAWFISNAQRLPNGNTLINDGPAGRFFEVTTDGEVVWEYINPYFHPPKTGDGKPTNRTFRCYRFSPELVEKARQTGK